MFKNVLRIAVQEAFAPRTRGRPALVGFDDAYDDILRVVRTGMQWRYLETTANRLRTHKSDGAVCSLLIRLDASCCNRDALASLTWCRVRSAHWPVVRGRSTLAGRCADAANEEYFVRTRLTKQTVRHQPLEDPCPF